MKEYEKYVQTDEYIKETAEDKLGLVNPNEIILNRRIKINKTKNKTEQKARQACTKDNSGEDFPEFFY